MRRFPLLFALAALPISCGGSHDGAPEPGPTADSIPFAARGVSGGDFVLVSGAGDTLRFASERVEDGSRILLSRTLRRPAGTDSVAALIDARSRIPIASYQRRFGEGGDSLVARISYGEGFEGQARLTLASPRGEVSDNLRTPLPFLDAAQLPQTLSALDLSRPDTISFNYVAPFERSAVAARIEIGRLDTLDAGGTPAPAVPVTIRVQGLEERAWFAAPPARSRLLRWEETTRRATWSRPTG